MNKTDYESPALQIINFGSNDIVTLSVGGDDSGNWGPIT